MKKNDVEKFLGDKGISSVDSGVASFVQRTIPQESTDQPFVSSKSVNWNLAHDIVPSDIPYIGQTPADMLDRYEAFLRGEID